jgi:hypothetical protein
MLFAFYFSVLFFATAGSRCLGLPVFSLGLGYAGAFAGLMATLPLTRDIASAGKATTALLLMGATGFWWLGRRTSPALQLRHHRPFLVYFLFLVALLLWQGAYVEIPSDPVGVHLFRMGDWLRDRYIPLGAEENGIFSSTLYFGYVFNSAAVALSPFARETSVEIIAVFNSLALATAFYGCAFYFLKRSLWAVLALIAAQLIMGISVYAYFRNYTFGPTLFNMVCVLDVLSILSSLKNRATAKSSWVLLALFFLVGWFTHKQEAIFVATAAMCTFLYFGIPAVGAAYRRVFLGLGVGCVVASVSGAGLGIAVGKILPPEKLSLVGFKVFFKIAGYPILMAHPLIWHTRTVLNFAFVLSVALSCAWAWREIRRDGWRIWIARPISFVFLFSLVPFAIAFFPPFASFYALFFYNLVFYRVFYLSFIFIVLPVAVPTLFRGAGPVGKSVVALAMAVLVWNCFWGPYARGGHFLARIHADETYRPALPILHRIAAMQIPKSKKNPGGISIYTDSVTAYPLNFFTGASSQTCYLWRCDFPGSSGQVEHTLAGFEFYLGTLDYLLYNTNKISTPSRFSGHWPPDIRDSSRYYDSQVPLWIETLEKTGKLKRVFHDQGYEFYKVDFQNQPR